MKYQQSLFSSLHLEVLNKNYELLKKAIPIKPLYKYISNSTISSYADLTGNYIQREELNYEIMSELTDINVIDTYIQNYLYLTDTAVLLGPLYITNENPSMDLINYFNLIEYENLHPLLVGFDNHYFQTIPEYHQIKSNLFQQMANEYKNWLLNNYESLEYLIVLGTDILKYLFPEYPEFMQAINKLYYKVFRVKIREKELKLMVAPTPLNIKKFDDGGFIIINNYIEILHKLNSVKVSSKTHIINSFDELKEVIDTVKSHRIAIDLETTALNPNTYDTHILSVAFSDGNTGYSFLVDHPLYKNSDGIKMLRYLLSQDKFKVWIFQNAPFDLRWIRKYFGDKIYYDKIIMDTLLLDHALYENMGSLSKKLKAGIYSMDKQIIRYLYIDSHKSMSNISKTEEALRLSILNREKFAKVKRKQFETNMIELQRAITERIDVLYDVKPHLFTVIKKATLLKYNALDTLRTFQIYEEMIKRIKKEWGEIPDFIKIVQTSQVKTITEMLYNGFKIDTNLLKNTIIKAKRIYSKYAGELEDKIDDYTWRSVNKGDFNLQSHIQLVNYLIKGLGISEDKLKDKYGKILTDKKTLKSLDFDWINDYIKFSESHKALSTYLYPFIEYMNGGRVYFNLNLTGTTTGRLSSNSPNFQNLPKAFLDGDEKIPIKPLFIADTNNYLVEADFSSLEVKVLTAYCPDPNLIKAIREGLDLHCYTASLIHGVDYEAVYNAKKKDDAGEDLTDEEKQYLKWRKDAKRAVFGTIYGISQYGLAEQIKSKNQKYEEAVEEASALLSKLKEQAYPEILAWFNRTFALVRDKGYVETIFRRRRRFFNTITYKGFQFIKLLLHTYGDELIEALYKDINDIEFQVSLILDNRPLRQAINFLVQSGGSDIVNWSIKNLKDRAKQLGLNVQLILTVHDSLVFQVEKTLPDNELFEKIKQLMKETWWDQIENTLVNKKIPVNIGYAGEISIAYTGNVIEKFSFGY